MLLKLLQYKDREKNIYINLDIIRMYSIIGLKSPASQIAQQNYRASYMEV